MKNVRSLSRGLAAAAVCSAAAIIACSERASVTPPLAARDASQHDVLVAGQLMVCKKGGPPGTYSFHVDISGGGSWTIFATDFSVNFDGSTLTCVESAAQTDPASWPPGVTSTVTVTELVPPGMHVDSIEVYHQDAGGFEPSPILNTATGTRQFGYTSNTWFKYFNAPSASPPTATCVSIVAIQGVPITPVTMTGSGGSGSGYTFSATGLPPGITMSSNGTISGTPTTTGTFNYAVTITDGAGNVGTVNCTIVVGPPGIPCPGGSFTFSYSANGDLNIVFDQFPAPNDNSYGVNAVGWPNGHKFSDLTGSDHAGFELVDPNGVIQLEFLVDYISAKTGTPSGYGSLGVTGGDGKMLIGTATGITATTSFDLNLNSLGYFAGGAQVVGTGVANLLINSPPTINNTSYTLTSAADAVFHNWNFHDTYFVTISAAKLASLGFNPATWSVQPDPTGLHNSPAKPCPPTAGTCAITVNAATVSGKNVQIPLHNGGTVDEIVTALNLTWPAATNGKLMQVKLGGDVIYDNPDISGGTASFTTANLVADPHHRTVSKGATDVLTFIFEKNADTDVTHYTGDVTTTDCQKKILPAP